MTNITKAIVLRLLNYGEADRIVTLFTFQHGKISAIAKGARRSRKRFGGSLSLFGYGDALLRERRGNDLWVLEDLYSAQGFSRLSQEIGRFGQASYACELCLELCPQGQPEPEIFEQLCSFLEQLDCLPLSSKPRIEPLLVFELSLLRHVGWQLSLTHCAACGRLIELQKQQIENQIPMDMERGVLCTPCLRGMDKGSRTVRWLAESVYFALCQLESQPFQKELFNRLIFPKEVLKTCREILLWVIQNHLGRKLQTIEFIHQMNQVDF